MSSGRSRFQRLALATAVTTLLLTAVGALVRATNSGLGCQDSWPTCRGGWVAPLEYHALIEYSHRALAAVVVASLVGCVVAARRWVRDDRFLLATSLAGVGVVLFQAALGALVVKSDLHATLVSAHFIAALALVGVTTTTAASAFVRDRPRATGNQAARISRMSVGALIALLPLLLVGVYVRERGAGLVFGDWPLMAGRLLPTLRGPGAALHFTHRLLALLVTGHLLTLALRARRDDRSGVRFFAFGGLALYLSQALVGAANVLTTLEPAAVVGHATLAFVTWSAFVALVVVSRRGSFSEDGFALPTGAAVREEPVTRPEESLRSIRPGGSFRSVRAFVALTKPRIIILLLVTTVPAMVLAERGLPSLWLVAATLTGGMLTAGSANALNQYLERDIDEKMHRTRKRPLPSHSVGPRSALVFAIVLGIAGFVWLTVTVNLLSACLAASAIAFYVLVYTVWLKRSTPQNIVIGGAAGAVPVLVGWAAVTGTVGAAAWVMFAIVFLWTPPHFWALAMRYRDDYAAAGVPMLPVVRGDAATTAQIVAYALVLVVVTLLLSPVGGLGALYAFTAAVLGGGFLYRAVRLRISPDAATAIKLFRYSITYLAVLFAAIAVDRLVW